MLGRKSDVFQIIIIIINALFRISFQNMKNEEMSTVVVMNLVSLFAVQLCLLVQNRSVACGSDHILRLFPYSAQNRTVGVQ